MKRTQIYLDETLFYLLKEESKKQGKSISEIIRQKLWTSFRSEDKKKVLLESTKKVFGLWKDREVDPEIYIRKMRKGDRLDSFGY